ncbi:MAG: hypothetical protein HC772_00785 [Leptolyngbyaceae cyanobacterium CRU_2_3]|nr:hypothetical protein [Leptolyngbyaceae cyanobacterium CRU_2_3]
MSLSAEECWKSLITRFGSPLEPDSLDEDALKLAIAERRALVTERIPDGFGSGELHFYRAQMGHVFKGKEGRWTSHFYVFSRPCEITDEEVAALDHPNPWESGSDLDRFTCKILSPECWKSLVTHYGSPLEPESLDEDTLKLAITEKRALKVVEHYRFVKVENRNGYADLHKSRYVYFERAEVGDAIRGFYMSRPYFCIVFPRPCEITDKEARTLTQFPFKPWEKVCEFTDAILRETPDSP